MATVITSRSESVLHYLNPVAMARNLWHHRDLIRQFTKREIEGRYKGSFLGLFWSFINPLILLLIYTFVFGVVFKSRWPEARTGNLGEFAVILFCGLSAFNIFSESVNRATGIIVASQSYVKKVVFPLEVLSLVLLFIALFHGTISFGILLVAHVLTNGALHWTLLLLPVVLMPMLLLSLGLMWFLASLGVFVRDVGYTVSLVVQVLIFVTPIFYTVETVPIQLQPLVRLNPLTSVVENVRRVVLWGQVPSWSEYLVWFVVSSIIMVLGYAWFMKTKKAFADVI